MAKRITKEKELEIIKFYEESPKTLGDVSKEFNLCVPTIIKILDKYRIKRYSKSKLFSPSLIENYFSNIDNEYKAYFLGLIITDGCIHSVENKQSLVCITLQEKDRYILNEFIKQIRSNKKPASDSRGCYSIQVYSDTMVNDLKKYGLAERKSLKTIFPTNIDKRFYKDLLRGMIDGDGSISYYARRNRKSHTKAIRLCQGNKQFLQDIIDFLYNELNIEKVNLYREKENLWSFAYRKDISIIKLIDYIYDNANIYMIRKKKLCDLVYTECKQYIDGNTEITE